MSSTEMKPFVFEADTIRVFTVDGEPWFVLADICRVLGLTNPSMVKSRLPEDDVNTLSLA